MRKFQFEPAPLVLAFVLGRMAEESIRQALLMSRGSFEILLTRPIATAFLAAAVAVMVVPLVLTPVKRALRAVPLEKIDA
jgi:putative tricarboxylic transport membrane protein